MAMISDIYVGKPDARDEVIFDGYDSFIKSFVAPPGFDFDSLLIVIQNPMVHQIPACWQRHWFLWSLW